MKRKRPFSLEEHVAAGNALKEALDTTVALLIALDGGYGRTHAATRTAWKVHKAVKQLQSALDDIVCREIPQSVDKTFAQDVYYGPLLTRKGVTDECNPAKSFAPSKAKRGVTGGPDEHRTWLVQSHLP